MGEFFVWPLTRRLVRLLEGVGMRVCPYCGCVTSNRYALQTHRIFRCSSKGTHAGATPRVPVLADSERQRESVHT